MRSGENAPLLFETRAQAIWSARKVAEAVAATGLGAEILVLNRDGGRAGCYVCPPAALELELS